MVTDNFLQRLAAPFAPSAIIWKPGATSGQKCMALPYADLRAYQDRLDAVCGVEWAVEYLPWGDHRVIARVTIAGITRASTGEMTAQEESAGNGGTVAEAQAFKRSCAMFGLGRYLYDLPSPWVAFDAEKKRITADGLAELNTRYKAWYARKVAGSAEAPADANGHIKLAA